MKTFLILLLLPLSLFSQPQPYEVVVKEYIQKYSEIAVKEMLVYKVPAGTTTRDGNIITSGGRVIAVTSYGKSMNEALAGSYDNCRNISFEGMYFRKDIGFDLEGQ